MLSTIIFTHISWPRNSKNQWIFNVPGQTHRCSENTVKLVWKQCELVHVSWKLELPWITHKVCWYSYCGFSWYFHTMNFSSDFHSHPKMHMKMLWNSSHAVFMHEVWMNVNHMHEWNGIDQTRNIQAQNASLSCTYMQHILAVFVQLYVGSYYTEITSPMPWRDPLNRAWLLSWVPHLIAWLLLLVSSYHISAWLCSTGLSSLSAIGLSNGTHALTLTSNCVLESCMT